MDWIKDFAEKYGEDKDIKNLAANKYHGYLQINFSSGKVQNCNMHQSKTFTVATPNSFTYHSYESRIEK